MSFRPENFSPESGSGPVCPHYDIIQICSELVGRENVFFCGVDVEHINTERILSGREGTRFIPKTICNEIELNLATQIVAAKMSKDELLNLYQTKEILVPNELEIWNAALNIMDQRPQILERFKKVVFNDCTLHVADDISNFHFKAINGPDEISNKDAIAYAERFLEALHMSSTNCEQHPREIFIGTQF